MARALILHLFLLAASLAQAQSWCPPGARWNFAIQAFAVDGHVVRTYLGDTVIDGLSAQRIHEAGVVIDYLANDTFAIDEMVYTAVQDSVVFTRVSWNGQPAWDTLYRFDAVIGDRWFPPGADSVCMNGTEGMLEVLDTGTVVVDGLSLRQWTISYIDASGQPIWGAFPMVERLGTYGGIGLLPGSCIIVEYGESLRCYDDSQIEYRAPGWTFGCGSVTALPETATGDLTVFPNPGRERFSMHLPGGPHTITLFDVTGRMVLQQRTSEARPVIGTEALPAGLYRIAVRDPQGAVMGATWVKE